MTQTTNQLIAKEAYPKLGYTFLLYLVLDIIDFNFLALLVFLFFLLMLYVYRNPTRNIVNDNEIIVSPIDGDIISIYTIGTATYIEIEKSIFDCSMLKAPISGNIISSTHIKGATLNSLNGSAEALNERIIIVADKYKLSTLSSSFSFENFNFHEAPKEINKGENIGIFTSGSVTLEITYATVFAKIGEHVSASKSILAKVNK